MPVGADGTLYTVGPNGQAVLMNPQSPWTPQASGSSSSAGAVPGYVNLSDPAQAAVWNAFQAKGLQPKDQGDFQYWVDNINKTGGYSGDNAGYWQSRLAQSNGGVGDYGNGSGGGTSSGSGNGFQYGVSDFVNGPFGQYALKQAQLGATQGAFAKGLGLSTGAMKDVAAATYGALGQLIPQDYYMQSDQFQRNFNNLSSLAQYGYNGTNAQAGYTTGAANAGAAGTVGAGNAWSTGLQNAGNVAGNYAIYSQINPAGKQTVGSYGSGSDYNQTGGG